MKNIGIIGAGWLGMELVRELEKDEKHRVRYTNRSSKGEREKSSFYRFGFGEEVPDDFIAGLDYLFITATLPKENRAQLLHFMEQLNNKIPSGCRICFTSTIGVYLAESGVVDESSSDLKTDSVYYRFEHWLSAGFPSQTVVLRLGGLIGEDRHPVFSLSGRKQIPDGQKAVNLVHRKDILRFFQCILHDEVAGGVYNLVFPEHPSRETYYTQKAIEKKLLLPEFICGAEPGKTVSSEKSREVPGFDYLYAI